MLEQKEQVEIEQVEDVQPALPLGRSRIQRYINLVAVLVALAIVAAIVVGVLILSGQMTPQPTDPPRSQSETQENVKERDPALPLWIDQQIIAMNGHARDGELLQAVNNIVVHYVGNPGTSAQNNRDYFNQPETMVSSHFVVGLNGEVILCVPLREVSSASNHRNKDTISIEVCHPDETGQFNEATYNAVIKLCAWLCERYDLEATDVIRHHDVTGKYCPLYYVEHPEAWQQFIKDVENYKEG